MSYIEDANPFDAVVVSGGGYKGIMALGVLHYYYEKGFFNPDNVTEYAGSSIGSVIVLLIICGYTPIELFSEIYSVNSFFTVNDCHSIWDIIKYMGLISINKFATRIEELVRRKLNCVPTLKKLKELTGKNLYISGTNITTMSEEKYCAETHPNLSCIDAVKISCNLPLVFQRLQYNNSFVVDGALINNYPWDYIPSSAKKILGVVLTGMDQFLSDSTFMGYFYRLMMIPMMKLTEMRCRLAPEKVMTVNISWNAAPLQLKMTSNQKMDMFLKGYQTTERKDQTKLLRVVGWDFKTSKTGEPKVRSEGPNIFSENGWDLDINLSEDEKPKVE